MNRSAAALTLALLVSSSVDGAAQRRSNTSGAPGQPLTVSVRLDGKAHESTGAGSCKHTPAASIYDIPAALWMIEYRNPAAREMKQLNLTLWRPKDGSPDQISLAFEAGSSSYRISSGGRAQPAGKAKVKVSPSGSGARFEVKGKDAEGRKVEVMVTCPALAGVEAEGG